MRNKIFLSSMIYFCSRKAYRNHHCQSYSQQDPDIEYKW